MKTDNPPLDLLAFGEILIDFVGTQTGYALAQSEQFQRCAGGAPANVAVGVRRLGRASGIIAKVGMDPFGDYLVQTLEQEGVHTTGMARSSHARTTLAFVSVESDGERDFTFFRHPGADTQWNPEQMPENLLQQTKVFHFGSLSLTEATCREATLHAARVTRKQGILNSMDPNLRLSLWERPEAAIEAVWELLPLVNFLKISEEELETLTGLNHESAALDKLRKAGPEIVILTRGGDPCRLESPFASRDIPGFAVKASDTTGAGDSFVAGWWSSAFSIVREPRRLIKDTDTLVSACRYAHATAALTVQKRGAIPALPTKSEVDDFLAHHSE